MKKLALYLIPFGFILTMISCNTDEQQLETGQDVTFQKIQEVTTDFLKNSDTHTNMDTSRAIDPEIAAIDIKAAIDTYNSGSSYKWSVQQGVVSSAAASNGVPPIFTDNSGVNIANDNNEFDSAGKYHVDILKYQLTEKKDYVFPNGVFNYERSVEVTRNYLLTNTNDTSTLPQSMSRNEFYTFYNYLNQDLQNSNYLLSDAILTMENQGKISSLESQILNMYFKMKEQTSSIDAYIQYSIQIENLVTNSNYPSDTKNLLLFTMATARYDFAFWNS